MALASKCGIPQGGGALFKFKIRLICGVFFSQSNGVLTTSSGLPVDDLCNSLTAGPRGPVVLQDLALIDTMAHFDRERIPERVVHAKGAGAFGYFEVTKDITKYCKVGQHLWLYIDL